MKCEMGESWLAFVQREDSVEVIGRFAGALSEVLGRARERVVGLGFMACVGVVRDENQLPDPLKRQRSGTPWRLGVR
jgi:hypothetical protein